MALFSGQIRSEEIGMDVGLHIILPHDRTDKKLKVLYLLHGLSDGCSAWTRWTRIEKYANEKGYIVIMPEVHRSFYMNLIDGGNYTNYILDELPMLCEGMFGIPRDREKTYIAGLSMGGYGAMRCAFDKLNQYKGCAALSAACDIKGRMDDPQVKEADDLYYLTEAMCRLGEEQRPQFLMTCGTEDFLYGENVKFKEHLQGLGYSFMYIEKPGQHDWDFWDEMIQVVMDFFNTQDE